MTALGAAALALITFSLLPLLTGSRRAESASPRLLAMTDLVGLLGWAALPAATAACLGSGLASTSGKSGSAQAAACWLGMTSADWGRLGIGLAAVAMAPLVWHALRVHHQLRSSELLDPTQASATQVITRSHTRVWVLPTETRLAYASGLWRPQAVVSRGALLGLGPEQGAALLEHEAAHVRLGHARLVVVAIVLGGAYGWLWPVRLLASALRRELEVAADLEAVRFTSRTAVLGALLGMCRARPPVASVGMGDPEHIRYRIRRLTSQPRRVEPWSIGVASLSVALAFLLAWTFCALGPDRSSAPALALCLTVISIVSLQTLRGRGIGRAAV